jgi:hypothetical protein
MSQVRTTTGRRVFVAPNRPRDTGRPAGRVQLIDRAACWWCGRPLHEQVPGLPVRESCTDCSETLSVPGRYLG